jgi:uncharacterized membrane protein (UPF0127 family)
MYSKQRKIILSTLSVFALISVVVSCMSPNEGEVEEYRRPAKESNAVFKSEGNLVITKATTGDTLKVLDIEIADNDYEITQGLMFRKSMAENRGMLFIQQQERIQSFWMRNTHISLDIIFINSAMEIVSAQTYAKPYSEESLPSEEPAIYILEVNAGMMEKWGLEKGDKVAFSRK